MINVAIVISPFALLEGLYLRGWNTVDSHPETGYRVQIYISAYILLENFIMCACTGPHSGILLSSVRMGLVLPDAINLQSVTGRW